MSSLIARTTTFEIDLPCEDKQKGPSKENRHDPIIGQALLLDADLVPLAMQMYPGNESEKPYIRKIIEEMKTPLSKFPERPYRSQIKGLTVHRNIYAAVKEADDGYIFSKSIHGRRLKRERKAVASSWKTMQIVWTDYTRQRRKALVPS